MREGLEINREDAEGVRAMCAAAKLVVVIGENMVARHRQEGREADAEFVEHAMLTGPRNFIETLETALAVFDLAHGQCVDGLHAHFDVERDGKVVTVRGLKKKTGDGPRALLREKAVGEQIERVVEVDADDGSTTLILHCRVEAFAEGVRAAMAGERRER
jgi:hypothetical protein